MEEGPVLAPPPLASGGKLVGEVSIEVQDADRGDGEGGDRSAGPHGCDEPIGLEHRGRSPCMLEEGDGLIGLVSRSFFHGFLMTIP